MKKILIIIIIFIALGLGYWLGWRGWRLDKKSEQNIGNVLEKIDKVQLTSPLPGDKVKSPLQVAGRARGQWFFEASFPLVVVDWDGRIIGESFAQAQGEWMTSDWVDFKGTIKFTPDTTVSNRGALILRKDNPSDLPENDDALEIPIFFE